MNERKSLPPPDSTATTGLAGCCVGNNSRLFVASVGGECEVTSVLLRVADRLREPTVHCSPLGRSRRCVDRCRVERVGKRDRTTPERRDLLAFRRFQVFDYRAFERRDEAIGKWLGTSLWIEPT